ncbi:MAG: hypothetical protein GEU88_05340 [Solirubrobacterales bacterium]|nr:hypothetical protein [Solirubrobacterales bacterium]
MAEVVAAREPWARGAVIRTRRRPAGGRCATPNCERPPAESERFCAPCARVLARVHVALEAEEAQRSARGRLRAATRGMSAAEIEREPAP